MNSEIKQLRDRGYSLQAIGGKFGVSKERVRQILKKRYGTTRILELTPREPLARLLGCSNSRLILLERRGVLNPILIGGRYFYNKDEAEKAATEVKCFPAPYVERICEECGKKFYVKPYEIQLCSPRRFCSKKCLGKYVGRHYGFRVHGKYKPRKYDYDQVYKLREETGWDGPSIGRALGIPYDTVYKILKKRFGIMPRAKRAKPVVQHCLPTAERECIGCGATHTRRSLFCSIKCHDRIRALVKYYGGERRGGTRRIKVPCSVCGAEIERVNRGRRHFCDEHLREYRNQVGGRLKER